MGRGRGPTVIKFPICATFWQFAVFSCLSSDLWLSDNCATFYKSSAAASTVNNPLEITNVICDATRSGHPMKINVLRSLGSPSFFPNLIYLGPVWQLRL